MLFQRISGLYLTIFHIITSAFFSEKNRKNETKQKGSTDLNILLSPLTKLTRNFPDQNSLWEMLLLYKILSYCNIVPTLDIISTTRLRMRKMLRLLESTWRSMFLGRFVKNHKADWICWAASSLPVIRYVLFKHFMYSQRPFSELQSFCKHWHKYTEMLKKIKENISTSCSSLAICRWAELDKCANK